jgi:hypothetical protein
MAMNKPFVNQFDIDPAIVEAVAANDHRPAPATALDGVGGDAQVISDLLTPNEALCVQRNLNEQTWQPVGHNGIAVDYQPGDEIGSWRASCHNPAFADAIWGRLSPRHGAARRMHDLTPTDWDGHRMWRPVGVNPLMRFIRYRPGGLLVPHYDAPYDDANGRRTLVTLVIYLGNDPGVRGGATRFISDPQVDLPLARRDYSDWDRLARQSEVIAEVQPLPGAALMFDHRVLHDSEPTSGEGCKTIARTDVLFERVVR